MNRTTASLHSPRLARKKRARGRRKLIFWATTAFVLIGGLLYLFNLPRFLISKVVVRGATEEVAATIGAMAQKTLDGSYLGILSKAHPFFYPKGALAAEALAAFPEFESANFGRDDTGELVITVIPRTPVALWCASSLCFFVDASGLAYGEASSDSQSEYYKLGSSETESPAGIVGHFVISATQLSQILALFSGLEARGLVPLTANFNAVGETEVTLENSARLLILTPDYETALARLDLLLKKEGLLPRRDGTKDLLVDYLDLRYGNKVYFKPK